MQCQFFQSVSKVLPACMMLRLTHISFSVLSCLARGMHTALISLSRESELCELPIACTFSHYPPTLARADTGMHLGWSAVLWLQPALPPLPRCLEQSKAGLSAFSTPSSRDGNPNPQCWNDKRDTFGIRSIRCN